MPSRRTHPRTAIATVFVVLLLGGSPAQAYHQSGGAAHTQSGNAAVPVNPNLNLGEDSIRSHLDEDVISDAFLEAYAAVIDRIEALSQASEQATQGVDDPEEVRAIQWRYNEQKLDAVTAGGIGLDLYQQVRDLVAESERLQSRLDAIRE